LELLGPVQACYGIALPLYEVKKGEDYDDKVYRRRDFIKNLKYWPLSKAEHERPFRSNLVYSHSVFSKAIKTRISVIP
jgi:hypothetical protein